MRKKYSIYVSVCPIPLTPPPQWMMPSWPLRSLCDEEACKVFLTELFFISQRHTCCVAWPPSPIFSLLSRDSWEAYPFLARFLPPSLPPYHSSFFPTFFFSFFSSFFVKRVWTHQILVNMLPYARLKPRPRSHRRNWRKRSGDHLCGFYVLISSQATP